MSADVKGSPVTGKIPEFSEQDREMATNYSILKSMCIAEEAKLRQLQHAGNLELTNQKRQQEEHEDKIRSQRQTLQVERQQHLQQMETEKLHFSSEEKRLLDWEKTLNIREQAAQKLEEEAAPIKAMKDSLTDLTLQAEKLRVDAQDLMHVAQARKVEADNAHLELNGRKAAVEEQERTLTKQFESLDAKSSALQLSMSESVKEVQRLTQLQQELTPRLEEFQKLKSASEEKSIQADALMKAAMQKRTEVDQASAELQDKLLQLQARQEVLLQFQSQLEGLRAQLEAKYPSETIPTIP